MMKNELKDKIWIFRDDRAFYQSTSLTDPWLPIAQMVWDTGNLLILSINSFDTSVLGEAK